MMNKYNIVKEVENYLNSKNDEFDYSCFGDINSSHDYYLKNTAIRLIKNRNRYLEGSVSSSDYLVSLRNFMITFNTPLQINEGFDVETKYFGIYEYGDSEHYMASCQMPSYIKNDRFVEDAFKGNYEPEENPDSYSLRTNWFIKELTGFKEFKSVEQKICVHGALNVPDGYTSLICMPTGGGKSLVTQTVAYAQNGLTIVVVPTVSLAIDQSRAAKLNIKHNTSEEIYCYYGGIKSSDTIFNAIQNRTARLLFISPEALLKNSRFREIIDEANNSKYLHNIVIDEAHIVIEWGDLFRVDYQCLEPWRNRLIKSNPMLKTFLLSATFEDRTVRYLKGMFSAKSKWIEIRCDSLRREPRFVLVCAKNWLDKRKKVLELVNQLPRPMIIYVNSPEEAESWNTYLQKYGYSDINLYTGKTNNKDREVIIEKWVNNDTNLIIATSAFGVGVDKPDVRTVLHLYVPESPNTYYQELGRGGRDGLPCLSVMCIDPDRDINTASDKITKVLTTDKFFGRWWTMYKNPENDWIDNKIIINTRIKPDYEYKGVFEQGNATDGKWNINALLLLRRNNMISIEDIDLVENDYDSTYYLTIRILDNRLTSKNSESYEVFDKIRNSEYKHLYESFDLLRESINNADFTCWSDMFCVTYPLVTSYCAGCNQHKNKESDYSNGICIHSNIPSPTHDVVTAQRAHFGSTNELLLIADHYSDKQAVFDYLKKYSANIIVSGTVIEEKMLECFKKPDVMIINVKELKEYLKTENYYFISGQILCCYGNDPNTNNVIYRNMKKLLNKTDCQVIHLANDDITISGFRKRISELINGAAFNFS